MDNINKDFFETLHSTQMNTINKSVISDARKVILKLILYMNTADKGINAEKDDAILDALRWIKNNVS